MTVVMGSAEPIYSDGYPCLCYDNLLGGDTYQVRRWPWPATYVAEPKGPQQRDGQQQRQFFSLPPDLLETQDQLALVVLLDHKELQEKWGILLVVVLMEINEFKRFKILLVVLLVVLSRKQIKKT